MNETKRNFLPGLWVVATPIGNLSDISLRAKEALAEATTILCEDTRQVRKLFSALKLTPPRLERCDAHTERSQIEAWTRRLQQGEGIALVSDAGTPALNDPGAALVRLSRESGVTVTPIPGPSALTAFLSAAGFSENAFTFFGFFPKKQKERETELRRAFHSEVSRLFVCFESPKRIEGALQSVAALYPDAFVVAAKELTKIHEKFFSGVATAVSENVRNEIAIHGERGEWCFGVQFEPKTESTARSTESSDWVKILGNLLNSSLSAPRAARQISQEFGIPRHTVYEMALQIRGKKFTKK